MLEATLCATCEECYMIAISVEVALRQYYLRLAELFAYEEPVRLVFRTLADEEGGHARMLSRYKSPEFHSGDIHEQAPIYARALLTLINKAGGVLTGTPKNLQEAWAFSTEMETSEVNNVYFRLTVGNGNIQDADQLAIKDQLGKHVKRLRELADSYDESKRLSMRPKGS